MKKWKKFSAVHEDLGFLAGRVCNYVAEVKLGSVIIRANAWTGYNRVYICPSPEEQALTVLLGSLYLAFFAGYSAGGRETNLRGPGHYSKVELDKNIAFINSILQ